MRSHTGGVMSMGTGALICKSSKQKIHTKSSTEAELVGASDYLPNTIWTKMFLEAQGHKIVENLFEQDNESAIRLEKNGRSSAGKQSRHIDIRYFFIKDRIKTDGINIRHCPTEAMLADFLTKPLQGGLFRKFRDVLLGYRHTNTLAETVSHMSPPEERVEENIHEQMNAEECDDSMVQESDIWDSGFEEYGNADKNRNANGSTVSSVESEWSLVGKKKKTKMTERANKIMTDTSNHKTKNKKKMVCKVYNFANNPS
jgi:hypothetical protein